MNPLSNLNQDNNAYSIRIIHPSIKLLSIILISGFVGQTGWNGILFTLLILLPFYSLNWKYYISALNMLMRVKWLLISIVVLYFFLLPTESIQQHNYNDLTAVKSVLYRLSIITVIIFAVNILLITTDKKQIISAVALLLSPFTKIGVDLDSFLLRTYLTMEFASKLYSELKKRKKNKKSIIPFIMSWLENAVHDKTDKIIIDQLTNPGVLQWFIPILLCFCYIFLL